MSTAGAPVGAQRLQPVAGDVGARAAVAHLALDGAGPRQLEVQRPARGGHRGPAWARPRGGPRPGTAGGARSAAGSARCDRWRSTASGWRLAGVDRGAPPSGVPAPRAQREGQHPGAVGRPALRIADAAPRPTASARSAGAAPAARAAPRVEHDRRRAPRAPGAGRWPSPCTRPRGRNTTKLAVLRRPRSVTGGVWLSVWRASTRAPGSGAPFSSSDAARPAPRPPPGSAAPRSARAARRRASAGPCARRDARGGGHLHLELTWRQVGQQDAAPGVAGDRAQAALAGQRLGRQVGGLGRPAAGCPAARPDPGCPARSARPR